MQQCDSVRHNRFQSFTIQDRFLKSSNHRFPGLQLDLNSSAPGFTTAPPGSHRTPQRLRDPNSDDRPGIVEAADARDLAAVRGFVRRDARAGPPRSVAAGASRASYGGPVPQSAVAALQRRSRAAPQPRTHGAAPGSVRRPQGDGAGFAGGERIGGGKDRPRSGASRAITVSVGDSECLAMRTGLPSACCISFYQSLSQASDQSHVKTFRNGDFINHSECNRCWRDA